MTLPLAASRWGAGPLLVCHPGGPGMHPHYLDALAGLATRREVVVLHPRGTGGSPHPHDAGSYSIQHYADDLVAWLECEADGPVDLLGHSHGGVVVLRVAARRPDLVRRVVLLATPAYGGSRAVDEANALHGTRVGEPDCAAALAALATQGDEYPSDADLGGLIAAVAPLWVGPMTAHIRRWQARVAAQPANIAALRYFNEQVFPDLDQVRADAIEVARPGLAIAGDLDGWAGPKHLALLERWLPTWRFTVIPGAGHMCHVDAIDQVSAAVATFLTEHREGPA